ncbi:MAG: T9SS type A sorting domain-containing protein [Bacteroidales bacterium]|nr:T9SS type A sorting domain-containing protein [Bacteroidales bacterium]
MKKISFIAVLIMIFGLNSMFAGHGWSRVNYPSSTIFTGIVQVDGKYIAAGDGVVGIFVGNECRMVAEVNVSEEGLSYVSAVIHCSDSLKGSEKAVIKYWSSKNDAIYVLDTIVETKVHGDIREFPISIKSGEVVTSETKKLVEKDEITVYPIPFGSNITIESTKPLKKVVMYDNLGKVVAKNVETSKSINITTGDFTDGMYFLSIEGVDGESTTKKVLKNAESK